MFSGIIETIGSVYSVSENGGDKRFTIDVGTLDISGLMVGESVAINGVCLTVVDWQNTKIEFDVSNETLSCTNINTLSKNSLVNLERALRLSDRINGHIVSGHVDTVAELVNKFEDARSWRFEFNLAKEFLRYVCVKGSVTVDGVSLTVNSISENGFSVNIIPHTLEYTLFKEYSSGSKVNIEVDMIARYLDRLRTTNS